MLNEQNSELRAEIEDAFSKAGIDDYVVVNATAIIEKIKKIMSLETHEPGGYLLKIKLIPCITKITLDTNMSPRS